MPNKILPRIFKKYKEPRFCIGKILPIEVSLYKATTIAVRWMNGFDLISILHTFSTTGIGNLAKKSSKLLFDGWHGLCSFVNNEVRMNNGKKSYSFEYCKRYVGNENFHWIHWYIKRNLSTLGVARSNRFDTKTGNENGQFHVYVYKTALFFLCTSNTTGLFTTKNELRDAV
jgi:hypothetical protein